jgi:hypothetical protein
VLSPPGSYHHINQRQEGGTVLFPGQQNHFITDFKDLLQEGKHVGLLSKEYKVEKISQSRKKILNKNKTWET